MGYPQNTPKWSFLVGKPIVVGYHHFSNPPYVNTVLSQLKICQKLKSAHQPCPLSPPTITFLFWFGGRPATSEVRLAPCWSWQMRSCWISRQMMPFKVLKMPRTCVLWHPRNLQHARSMDPEKTWVSSNSSNLGFWAYRDWFRDCRQLIWQLIRLKEPSACSKIKPASWWCRNLGKLPNLTTVVFRWVGSTTTYIARCLACWEWLLMFQSIWAPGDLVGSEWACLNLDLSSLEPVFSQLNRPLLLPSSTATPVNDHNPSWQPVTFWEQDFDVHDLVSIGHFKPTTKCVYRHRFFGGRFVIWL